MVDNLQLNDSGGKEQTRGGSDRAAVGVEQRRWRASSAAESRIILVMGSCGGRPNTQGTSFLCGVWAAFIKYIPKQGTYLPIDNYVDFFFYILYWLKYYYVNI